MTENVPFYTSLKARTAWRPEGLIRLEIIWLMRRTTPALDRSVLLRYNRHASRCVMVDNAPCRRLQPSGPDFVFSDSRLGSLLFT